MRPPLKKDAPAENTEEPPLTFQMLIKPNGEIGISGYQHNESLSVCQGGTPIRTKILS
jgi:hypothetical protein